MRAEQNEMGTKTYRLILVDSSPEEKHLPYTRACFYNVIGSASLRLPRHEDRGTKTFYDASFSVRCIEFRQSSGYYEM